MKKDFVCQEDFGHKILMLSDGNPHLMVLFSFDISMDIR